MAIETERAARELAFIRQRLELARRSSGRLEALTRAGNASRANADEALAQVVDLELLREEQEKIIALAEVRRQAAQVGMYFAIDGSDPDWAFRSRDDLRLEVARVTSALAEAEAALAKARAAATAAQTDFDGLKERAVTAPGGSVVWSVIVGAGAAVDVGTPAAEWLDCNELLVDVPVADVELALLSEGMKAEVIIEGETQRRAASVRLVRGSASTIGSADLAAIAKGRTSGIGQVVLALQHTPADVARCPVGHAAYVDFPDIGLIEDPARPPQAVTGGSTHGRYHPGPARQGRCHPLSGGGGRRRPD